MELAEEEGYTELTEFLRKEETKTENVHETVVEEAPKAEEEGQGVQE